MEGLNKLWPVEAFQLSHSATEPLQLAKWATLPGQCFVPYPRCVLGYKALGWLDWAVK